MVKRKDLDQVYLSIDRFVNHLKMKGITLDKVILFGSWARGIPKDKSDIDLCLVSKKFGNDEVKELQFLLYQARAIDERIEPIPLSLSDYNNNATPMVLEIKKYGKVLPL
ncbi:hypothetical protein A2160_05005 [Candidatus Beckwithbacteria bacterium RBG_13_42_9]|uniref:Polymerase beta nucleotidyltransferase domain-containing protein n=1 Tax=Candidatus Beckwithbacteria bacterium RBG_13_42_9 TaxID=1797457 RepID=A0A1F5E844_9BACT|nr:MAG: hypothetical protein A2160_05005 [Candidatus Beckwithbacteria bacterium RBG_13_42_9]